MALVQYAYSKEGLLHLLTVTVQVLSSCRIDEIRAAVQKDVTCQQLADMIRKRLASQLKITSLSLASLLLNER